MGSQVYEPRPRGVYAPRALWPRPGSFLAETRVIRGIVLAAGASTRMGQAKAALPFGHTGETVVSRVVRTLLRGGVPDVTVVAGAHIDAVRIAMPSHEPRARVIEHPGWQQGQLSSLLKGLEAIDEPAARGRGGHARRRAAGVAVNRQRRDRGMAPNAGADRAAKIGCTGCTGAQVPNATDIRWSSIDRCLRIYALRISAPARRRSSRNIGTGW